jgi:hypothetical protein
VFVVEMPSEIRVSGIWPVDIIGYTIGDRRLIGAIFLTAVVRTQNKYQKANTYEHSLQTLGGGASPFEENLPRGRLMPVKKCKRSRAAFVLAVTLRASICREFVL